MRSRSRIGPLPRPARRSRRFLLLRTAAAVLVSVVSFFVLDVIWALVATAAAIVVWLATQVLVVYVQKSVPGTLANFLRCFKSDYGEWSVSEIRASTLSASGKLGYRFGMVDCCSFADEGGFSVQFEKRLVRAVLECEGITMPWSAIGAIILLVDPPLGRSAILLPVKKDASHLEVPWREEFTQLVPATVGISSQAYKQTLGTSIDHQNSHDT